MTHYLSNTLGIDSFMRPFYLALTKDLKISRTRHVEAAKALEDNLCTSWGGGRVVNSLLFDDTCIVPFRQTDVRGQPSSTSDGGNSSGLLPYNNGVPNTVFGIILLNSEF